MTAQVLNLDAFRRDAMRWSSAPPADEHIPYCVSAKRRNRRKMRLAWNKAKFRVDFYRAMADFALVLELATYRKDDFLETRGIPALDRMAIVDQWRRAIAALIMTPASTVSEIAAKKVLLRNHFAHVGVNAGRRAIAADKKWLAKNPYRAKSKKSSGATRRH